MKYCVAVFGLVSVIFASDQAAAQTSGAYQTGLRIAQARGVADTACYAQVFARHARLVEDGYGRRSWLAASTPQYNNELARRCGFDRRAAIRSAPVMARPQPVYRPAYRPAYRTGGQESANGHPAGGGYMTGLKRAYEIGHPNPRCYAQVWSRYAHPVQPQDGKGGYWWRVNALPALAADVKAQCG